MDCSSACWCSSSGRYGHTISTIGSTLYVFGGQCDDYFFDDLVAYDLSTLQTPGSKWNFIKPKTPSPPPRTNHTMITFDEKLYLLEVPMVNFGTATLGVLILIP